MQGLGLPSAHHPVRREPRAGAGWAERELWGEVGKELFPESGGGDRKPPLACPGTPFQPQASLRPWPHPRWLQNGRPAEELAGVRVASQGTTLHIDHVELAHAGLFACQATNDVGTTGAEVEVSVHGELCLELWGWRQPEMLGK